jgi:hypothetical protein
MKDATNKNEFIKVHTKVTGIKKETNFDKIMKFFISRSNTSKKESYWDQPDYGGRSRKRKQMKKRKSKTKETSRKITDFLPITISRKNLSKRNRKNKIK